MCLLSALLCVCGVPSHLAPVHRCARLVRCFVFAVSWATWLLFTGVPAWFVVLRVRCPGPLGSCSTVCPLRLLFCLCGVLGHLAPVHRCARVVCCVACAVSWATWLLFTGVPARCVALRVQCPGLLGSCSPMYPLSALFSLCSVLGHLAPVHWCAPSLCCFACALSGATWLLFTGVPARCVALRVQCPWRLGSCSPVCPLSALPVCAVSWTTWLLFTGVPAWCVLLLVRCPRPLGSWSPVCALGALFCLCSVLGHLVPVQLCACLVCCVACAVSRATWLLFTGVPARCVVVRVRCPGPPGLCSPVRSPGVLCGVLGHLAPVHRCARSVCCAVGCVCGASLRGAHSSIWTAAIRSRQGLGTLRAHTRPSGQRLFCSRQGLGSLPGAHTSVRTAAGVAWHLSSCRGSLRVVRALRVCGTRRPLLLGTCPCALVVAGGVPLWRASWPRVVRRASSSPVALGAPVGFPNAVVPFPTPGACAPGFIGWLRGARGGRPRTEPGRTRKHEHPYDPLHHSCHTPEHRTQALTCHDLNPDAAYILHYIFSYLTQGQPEQGLIAMSPQAKHIISKGIGLYATPILQPTTPVAHLATGLAIYAYLPMNPCRLPQPSPADRLFFTDASGESAPTPIAGGATLQLTHTGGHYHMDHHTGHTTYGASFQGELGAMADAIAEIATHLPANLPHIVRVWFVVDSTVDTHLLLRIARQPLHKATATSLGTQALLLWKALRSLPPYVQLHIMK